VEWECKPNQVNEFKKAAQSGLFFYFPNNKFIVVFLFLFLKDFFEAKTHA